MSEDETSIHRAEEYWPIVKDLFHEYDIWKNICIEFSKYEDLEKQFIPFDICELIEASKKIGHDDPKLSGIQIIILTSIIEALSIRVNYETFPTWYKENIDLVESNKCLSYYDEYLKIHGSGKYFKNFFFNLEQEDKFDILLKIKKKHNNEIFAPFCYQSIDECFDPNVVWKRNDNNIIRRHILYYPRTCKAEYSRKECPAMNNDKVLKEGIEKFCHHLQVMRNKFVHQSILPSKFLFEQPYMVDEKSKTIRYSALIYTMKKENSNNIDIFDTTLTPEYLYNLVIKYLKKLFYDYLDEVPQK